MPTRSDVHLNPASQLPPVDCPLLIEVSRTDGLLRATRPTFIAGKGDDLIYILDDGQTLTGRFRWTYP